MTKDEATQLALGYAWASEDVSKVPTAGPADRVTTLAFAEAFAHGWSEYNSERQWFMIPVRDAYVNWQASAGASIYSREQIASLERVARTRVA